MSLHELTVNPEGEADELVGMWVARGLPEELARQVVDVVKHDPRQALRLHAQEELGVVPDELPNPWTAAGSSFVAFSIGALVPLISYLLGADDLGLALAVGGCGLFVTGAIVARLTARPWWLGGLRQLALGAMAALATYGVGLLLAG